ncbi:MAG TPA: T9SS type A sorting domain-containing protein, partial [bacterium]
IPASAESLEIGYNYFFSLSYGTEFYDVNMRKCYGGSWGARINLRNYMSDTSGRDLVDLSSFLPADSMQFDWTYRNIWGSYQSLCIVDSVIVGYFDLNKLNEDNDNDEQSKQQAFFITPSLLKSGAVITYTISQPITGSLDLFDALGRKIMRIHKGKFSVGRHLCEIRKDLKPGVYFMILDTPGIKMHQKLVLE